MEEPNRATDTPAVAAEALLGLTDVALRSAWARHFSCCARSTASTVIHAFTDVRPDEEGAPKRSGGK
jgi:hypothetical protein